jgi:hypothetical protein
MLLSEVDLAVFYYDLALREIERVTRGQVTLVIVHRYAAGVAGAQTIRPRWRVPGAEVVSVACPVICTSAIVSVARRAECGGNRSRPQ